MYHKKSNQFLSFSDNPSQINYKVLPDPGMISPLCKENNPAFKRENKIIFRNPLKKTFWKCFLKIVHKNLLFMQLTTIWMKTFMLCLSQCPDFGEL